MGNAVSRRVRDRLAQLLDQRLLVAHRHRTTAALGVDCKRASARAQIRLAIEDVLDDGLPKAYTKELYQTKCNVLFEHVYESYFGDGGSVYRDAA